jgi:hypothetical protein
MLRNMLNVTYILICIDCQIWTILEVDPRLKLHIKINIIAVFV